MTTTADRGGSAAPRVAPLRRVPPAVWFFACLAGGWAAGLLFPLRTGLASFELQLSLALALFAAAALFGWWAIALFQRAQTTILPFGRPAALVTSGPFRLSRNPLYVVLVALLVAFGILLDSLPILLLTPALFFALDRLVIRDEEVVLRELFGEEYERYEKSVRRWL